MAEVEPTVRHPKSSHFVCFFPILAVVATGLLGLLLPASVHGGAGPVLLDFHSNHCAPCQHMRPILNQLASAGYPIQSVNVEQAPDLAARFRVTGVPCFVLVDGQQEVDRVVGATSPERIQAMFAAVGYKPGIRVANQALSRQPGLAFNQPSPRGVQPDSQTGPANSLARTRLQPVAHALQGGGETTKGTLQPNAATAQQGDSRATTELREQIRMATVRLSLIDEKGTSHASGTIIHAQGNDVLILTCGHLFQGSVGQPRLLVDFYCSPEGGASPGVLLGYDVDRDVGLISAKIRTQPVVLPLAASSQGMAKGDVVFSSGCNQGQPPTVWPTHITAINKYDGPANLEAAREPLQGRSGGGLFNARGELIGVCNAADPADKEGLYSDVKNVWMELEKTHLTKLVQGSQVRMPRGSNPSADPSLATSPRGARGGNRANADGISQSLAAAAEPTGTEVICIVRPKGESKPRVLVLDRPSRDFLAELEQESTRQDARQLTSFQPEGIQRARSTAALLHPVHQEGRPTQPAAEQRAVGGQPRRAKGHQYFDAPIHPGGIWR